MQTDVVESRGVAAVTFESVAEAAGLTRGGVTYHFPSRDELVTAIHHHLAQEWESALEEALAARVGADLDPADPADPAARLIAYIHVNARSATRAELQMVLEAESSPELASLWQGVMKRWLPDSDDGAVPESHRLAVLAADGLWVHDAISGRAMGQEQRIALARRIEAMVVGDE